MLSAGNDSQFAILCSPALLDRGEWLKDERFSRNEGRVTHRDEMVSLIEQVLSERTTSEWCERLMDKG